MPEDLDSLEEVSFSHETLEERGFPVIDVHSVSSYKSGQGDVLIAGDLYRLIGRRAAGDNHGKFCNNSFFDDAA